MSSLKPIDKDYRPGYPSMLTLRVVDELLTPGLLQRFSAKALRAGAALGGAALIAAGGMSPAQAELASSGAPSLAQPGPEMDERVSALITKLRGPDNRGVHPKARPLLTKELESNPVVRYPRISVHFGNSYMGILDTTAAKAATKQLFALYGINLRDDVTIRTGGYEFIADGYDPVTKTGFEILEPRYPNRPVKEAAVLSDNELPLLNRDVKAGNTRFFVARADNFPIVDIDSHAHWTYYLESVASYLRFIHGQRP